MWFAGKRRSQGAAAACYLWTMCVLAPRVALADTIKRRGYLLTRSALRAVAGARAPLPPFGVPWRGEPVAQKWLDW